MKKSLFCLVFMCLAICAFCNDTFFVFYGGSIIPMEENDITVRMEEEVIKIVINEDYYEVTVDFSFYNYGNDVGLYVGFPFFGGTSGYSDIYDFKCWTNDEETDYIIVPFNSRSVKKDKNSNRLEVAHIRKINFTKNNTTKTKISYKVKETSEIKYLYGTGSSWKDSIGKITLIIENNRPYYYLGNFKMPNDNYTFNRLADNKWEACFYNIEPNYTDCIEMDSIDLWRGPDKRYFPEDDFYFCENKVSKDDLFWYTKPQLRILRNTIYALHGYKFKSEDLMELFTTKWSKWYKIDPNFTEDWLSKIEIANIQMMYNVENTR